MARIEIRGVQHAVDWRPACVEAGGDPATLVFVHGWLLSRAYWQPIVTDLADRYNCLTYDLRGFGESQPDRDRPTLNHPRQLYEAYAPKAYAEDLSHLLDRLQIDSAWLVGHSLGGAIALWAAQACPDRVRGVICVNFGGGIYLKEDFERFRAVGRQLVRLRPRWLAHVPGIDRLFRRDSVACPVAHAWGRQRVRDFTAADTEAALWTLLESTTEIEVHRLPRVVAELSQPAYFLAGDRDRVMETKYVQHLASFHSDLGLSGQNLTIIENCGHLGPVEQPTAIAQTIDQILASHVSLAKVD